MKKIKNWGLPLGLLVAFSWATYTAVAEMSECAPHWSGMCGVGFGLLNLPGAAVLVFLQIGTGDGTAGFIVTAILVALINGFLIGAPLHFFIHLGQRSQSEK